MAARPRTKLALLIGGLGGATLLAAGLSTIRVPGFADALPFAPPIFHGVLEAYSQDGLRFEVADRALRFPAETQHQSIATDGGRLLIYFDGHDEQIKLMDLDSGATEPLTLGGDCDADPPPGTACVDPVWVRLDDGRQRLYYTAAPRGQDPALMTEPIEVHSAISGDGRRWEPEQGARLAGRSIVDPDVLALPDGRFRMYYTSLEPQPGAPPGEDLPAVYSAISADGIYFEREPGMRLQDASATTTVALPDGGFRTYYHPFASGIVSAHSADGLTFEPDQGLRIPGDPLPGSRWVGSSAPAVIRLDDGSYWMTLNAAREPRWPFNLLAVRRYGETPERTAGQPEGIKGPPPPPGAGPADP